jgi:hypothetical protein
MAVVIRIVSGLLLIGAGCLVSWAGIIRLGWRRHGATWTDLGFLHLDWILQPDLPYWPAHMFNLAVVLVGMIAVVFGSWIIVRILIRTKPARRA